MDNGLTLFYYSSCKEVGELLSRCVVYDICS